MSRDRDPFHRALAYVRRHALVRPGDRVLVGVGGGGASLGLLGFLLEAQSGLGLAEVAAASVESDADERSEAAEAVADVGRIVRQLGLTFHAVRPQVRRGQRVDVLRELQQLAREQGFHRLALGHARDDDAVAVLCDLVAGRGLESVAGLRPHDRRRTIIRPLLGLGEAEACSLARGLLPLQPPRGAPDPQGRLAARLGSVVMPRLRALVPGLDQALARVGREARAVRRLGRLEARRRVAAGRRSDGSLELAAVPEGPWMARVLAGVALEALGLPGGGTAAEIARLAHMLVHAGGSVTETLLVAGACAVRVPARGTVILRAAGTVPGRPGEDWRLMQPRLHASRHPLAQGPGARAPDPGSPSRERP